MFLNRALSIKPFSQLAELALLSYMANARISASWPSLTPSIGCFMRQMIASVLIYLVSVEFLAACAADVYKDNIFNKNICGPLALSAAADFIGRSDLPAQVFHLLPPSGEPRSLDDLRSVSDRLGLQSLAVRWSREANIELNTPAVIRLKSQSSNDLGHFILLVKRSNNSFFVIDPPHPAKWIPADELWKSWDGVALHLSNSKESLPRVRGRINPGLFNCMGLVASGFTICLLVVSRLIGRNSRGSSQLVPSKLLSVTATMLLSGVIVSLIYTSLWFFSSDQKNEEPLSVDNKVKLVATKKVLGADSGMVTVKFKVHNNTSKTAQVSDFYSSCGCAAPNLSSRSVEPFKDMIVSVELDGNTNIGSFRVTIKFSQPDHFILELVGVIDSSD